MIWLVGQTWILLVISFVLGALVTWLVLPRRTKLNLNERVRSADV